MEALKNILELFKKEIGVHPWGENEDPCAGTLFKHNVDGKMYKYLFSALPLPSKKSADLMVVCQDADDGSFFTCKWNHFFSSTKINGERISRFEEQHRIY